MNKKVNISIGVTSVIMVFVVLIFTVFGVMSFSIAKTDATLTEKTLKSAKLYYEIDNECETLLCDIDEMLLNIRNDIKLITLESSLTEYDELEDVLINDTLTNEEKINYIYFYLVTEKLDELNGEYDIKIDNSYDGYINVKVELVVSETVQYKLNFNILAFDQKQRYDVLSRYTYANDSWDEEYIEVWDGEQQ